MFNDVHAPIWRRAAIHFNEREMIAHETPGMDAPLGLGARLGEGFQEADAVGVIAEDRLAAIAAVQDVVDRAWILGSQFPNFRAMGFRVTGPAAAVKM